MRNALCVFLAAAAMASAAGARAQTTLVLLRHGEKPDAGLGQINCQGLNRALALPDVLLAKFGRPDALYAPNPGIGTIDMGTAYNYIRPLATIEPTAIRLSLPVDTRWGLHDLPALEDDLLSSSHAGQLLFIAWEHSLLVQLVRDIVARSGADPRVVPDWDRADFDSLYVLSLPAAGPATFRLDHEGLDGQSPLCPGQR